MKKISEQWLIVSFGLMLFMAFVSHDVFAADRISLRDLRNVLPTKNRLATVENARDILGMPADENLMLANEMTDLDGNKTFRYRQTFQGLPVWNEHIIVKSDGAGFIKAIRGHVIQGMESDVAGQDILAGLNEASVLSSMKGAFERDHGSGFRVYKNESSRKMIYRNDEGKAVKAFVVSFFTYNTKTGQPSRPVFIVDAMTGAVLTSYESLDLADAYGPGGNGKTGEYEYGTNFPPLDVTQSGNDCIMENDKSITVDISDIDGEDNQPFVFECPENTVREINGAFSPLNDAHFFSGMIHDMYVDWFGSPPLPFKIVFRVHFGMYYKNAFWAGDGAMFGDGGLLMYPLMVLDAASHEVGHGFIEQHSDLISFGEAAGIEESFCDMAGEAAEYYVYGSNDFMVGFDVYKFFNRAIRYMDDPTSDRLSIDHVSDYDEDLDCHYSSGIYNKAFYTLAVTPGWDTRKAFEVFVKANQDYWVPQTTFESGAFDVLSSCRDLGYDTQAVADAFSVVGIDVSSAL